jgi:1-acyl-sn-glycerol-3-phosphate acyltransferase
MPTRRGPGVSASWKVARSLFAHAVIWTQVIVLGTICILLSPFTRGQIVIWLGPFWGRVNFKVSGVTFTMEGLEKLARGRVQVLVGNHTSNYDIYSLMYALKGFNYRFLVKKEVLYLPVLGWALWAAGFPFVDRSHGAKARRTMKRTAERLQRSGTSIVTFPEGTRNCTQEPLLPFKKGAFVLAIDLQAPIVPFAIHGAREVQPRHRLTIEGGPVRLVFLDPIPTEGMTYADRDALMEKARSAIENELRKSSEFRVPSSE